VLTSQARLTTSSLHALGLPSRCRLLVGPPPDGDRRCTGLVLPSSPSLRSLGDKRLDWGLRLVLVASSRSALKRCTVWVGSLAALCCCCVVMLSIETIPPAWGTGGWELPCCAAKAMTFMG